MDREDLRQRLSAYCKQLKLSQCVVALSEQRANEEQERFLHDVLHAEVEHRNQSRRAKRLNKANFPSRKRLEDFDFSNVQFPTGVTIEDLADGSYIRQKQNLIFYGQVGTGKTHLAIALGMLACEQDYAVRFYTLSDLVLRLGEAHRSGRLERLMAEIQGLDLLILDEWGYVPVDRQGSQLLFRVISDCYERKSLIVTTNMEFSAWGTIFTDEQMAAAMIDRLVHFGYLILCGGPSYRIANALMRKNTAAVMEVGMA
ncbi:MAG: IS21-like element helper ATPase IstB [Saccharofermentanales bacterium]|jgi:DNA replication protein DnaC